MRMFYFHSFLNYYICVFNAKKILLEDKNDADIRKICFSEVLSKFENPKFLSGKYVKCCLKEIALKLKNEYK